MQRIDPRNGGNMASYATLSKEELRLEFEQVTEQIEQARKLGLKLDISRGKPGAEQLSLSTDLLTVLASKDDCFDDGLDARNYGTLAGLPSARNLFAELLGTNPEQVFVGGNASLQLMYDLISKAYTHGLKNSTSPWSRKGIVRFLCPAPGYDRHFKISETFGMEMITVAMTENGPDMDAVEQWVKDPDVLGMWCCPKYSNPDGIIYSNETVERIASLRPAAPDFTVIWDNAYCVHEFDGPFVPFPDILSLAEKHGNPDMVYEFTSTSKITFPGAGISCMASSKANIDYLSKLIGFQIISYDKLNQLRHVRFLKNKENILQIMKKQAEILKPKFDAVLKRLEDELGPFGIARWTKPKGGYFISLYAMNGTAKRTVSLVKDLGVTMTGAGATYPYGKDPFDSNIRIAPTNASMEEIDEAVRILCLCLRYSALEQLLRNQA